MNETTTCDPVANEVSPERPYLLVFDGGTSSLYHLPSAGSVLIGGGEGVDLSLSGDSVARRHARLMVSAESVTLTDLGREAGTRVNGVRIESAILRSGDVVTAGDVTLVLQMRMRVPLEDTVHAQNDEQIATSEPRRFRPISEEIRELERGRMIEALEATKYVQTRAAELIAMPLRTFVLKLKQYGIRKPA